MIRDEWNAVLAAEPATPNQRGAVMREFGRLGFGDADRAERLAVCAGMLGLAELGSTRDLTKGQAGYLVRLLGRCGSRADLPAQGAGNSPRNSAPPRPCRCQVIIAELAVALYRSRHAPLAMP